MEISLKLLFYLKVFSLADVKLTRSFSDVICKGLLQVAFISTHLTGISVEIVSLAASWRVTSDVLEKVILKLQLHRLESLTALVSIKGVKDSYLVPSFSVVQGSQAVPYLHCLRLTE